MATKWTSPTWRMPEESNQSKFENYSLEFPGTGGYVTCTSAGDLFGRSGYGVGLQKGSPWADKVTLAILDFHESKSSMLKTYLEYSQYHL